MKRYILIAILFTKIGLAQIPTGYYNSAMGLTGAALKVSLHNIIKNHTQTSYSNLWNSYKKTDVKANGKVWDIYSNVASGIPPYEYTFVTNQCGNYSVEGDCYNREHSWPQSWFNSLTGPVSDMFHIYPTDGKVNGVRSNYPYGNVSAPTWTSLNGSKLGPCINLGYSSTVFEPIDEYKGDVARSYFYMSTRYYNEDAGWSTSDATNKSDILPWEVAVLLQWHHQDVVSAKEIARNDSIYYRFQNNRNPFIDNPQWADSIWHNISLTVDVANSLQHKVSYSIYPNPASDLFYITNNAGILNETIYIKITTITGEVIIEKLLNENTVECLNWANGIYFIELRKEDYSYNFKLIKN